LFSLCLLLFLYCSSPLRHLLYFPTRRSSDLLRAESCSLSAHARAIPATLPRPDAAAPSGASESESGQRLSSLLCHSPHRCQSCQDRKSTRLNSSHQIISYAVFCLKKKNKNK